MYKRQAQDGDGKAMRVNAALRLDSDTRDWFRFDNRGRMSGAEAIVVETSTEGVEGRGLSFDFSFLAGNHDINRSWGYPVEWKVEYSADGLPFIDAGRIFVLRPVVYNDAVIKDLGLRRLSYDAALGFTEYSVPLPVSLLGHKRLTVRLTPASARESGRRLGRRGRHGRFPPALRAAAGAGGRPGAPMTKKPAA